MNPTMMTAWRAAVRSHQVEQTPRVGGIEYERLSLVACAPWARLYRGVLESALPHEPGEQARERAAQVVVAAWAGTRPGQQKPLDQIHAYLGQAGDVVGNQVIVEQRERLLLHVVAPSERSLVGEELLDVGGHDAAKALAARFHRTSSPSPCATSRSASIATLP
jgi:hypothetical protein